MDGVSEWFMEKQTNKPRNKNTIFLLRFWVLFNFPFYLHLKKTEKS